MFLGVFAPLRQHTNAMTPRRIQILPDHLANKIAAGEVIQRPDSVVKELLENSIDAGAKNILVLIEDGGKQLIRIVDDGIGMDEQDAVNSFLRHATSKITSYEDLEAIATYGFRGEALASIAAVAQVTMKTRRETDDMAVVVQIDGEGEPRISREGREPGTLITVQNLFFNTPARRKFLKSSNTEFRHIYDAVQRVALSHPEVGVKLTSDDEVQLDVKPATLEQRVRDIFGQRQVEGMVWMEEQGELFSLSGYIGKPTFGQKSRANQFLFLNKRYIIQRNISHAVFTAYEHLLIKGTYPFFLLYLDIDPHRVDVNVHPSKMEAKFEDEHMLYRFASTAVRKCLATNNLVPALTFSEQENAADALQFTNKQHAWPSTQGGTDWFPGGERVDKSTGEILPAQEPLSFRQQPPSVGGSEITERLLGSIDSRFASAGPEKEITLPSPPQQSRLTWQIHNKYIIAQIENGVMIVDQHAAHERILYERAVARFSKGASPSQQLMFPVTAQISPGDYSLLTELLPHFESLGFSIKLFGKDTIVIDAVPLEVKVGNETKIVQDLLMPYKENSQHGVLDKRDALAKSFSCKAAIKAGDRLNDLEMRSLLDQLFATTMPYVCPHGRPVVLKIATDELDKRFGRK
ncbi:MAG: mutL [Bacteroidetes bacterium]|nr:mutL [Bacteroidota bacterium]